MEIIKLKLISMYEVCYINKSDNAHYVKYFHSCITFYEFINSFSHDEIYIVKMRFV